MPAEEATEEVLDGEEYPDGKERMSLVLHILDRTIQIWQNINGKGLIIYLEQKRWEQMLERLPERRRNKVEPWSLFYISWIWYKFGLNNV